MKKSKHIAAIILGLALGLHACKTKPATSNAGQFNFSVQEAPEWSALFKRNHGWFGGDGIYAATLKGNEKPGAAAKDSSIIWFSDTMIGDIVNDSLQNAFRMINNSIAVIAGAKPDSNKIKFYWNKAGENDAAIFIPQTEATQTGEYYWLGDGFVNTTLNNDIYIFGYRIKNIPEQAVFGFQHTGTTLIRIPRGTPPPYHGYFQKDIPFFQNRNIDSLGSFGSAILVNTKEAGATNADGYLYIYGIRGKNKEVIAARVKPHRIEVFEDWHFWNGKSWSQDPDQAYPVADSASNELSVTALENGKFLMIFQKNAIEPTIALRVGDSPIGPFGPMMAVYNTKKDIAASPNLFTYNAKAHPIFSEPGELLISYNVNSFDFNNDIKKYPHLYRPRFIKLKYSFR